MAIKTKREALEVVYSNIWILEIVRERVPDRRASFSTDVAQSIPYLAIVSSVFRISYLLWHVICWLWWIFSSGSECSVEVSTNEPSTKGFEVPSVILSAFQSVQCRRCGSSTLDRGCCHANSCDVSSQSTTSQLTQSSGDGFEQTLPDSGSVCTTDRNSEQSLRQHDSRTHAKTERRWRPLLLVVPLRLGLSEINPVYYSSVKVNGDVAGFSTLLLLFPLLLSVCRLTGIFFWRLLHVKPGHSLANNKQLCNFDQNP